jgi:2',3'-cyclic-nucleotide 2'-phosphodiesterase (5'-nucleotidase family)
MEIRRLKLVSFLLLIIFSCGNNKEAPQINTEGDTVTLFFINDPHARLRNFAKIKHIVDKERADGNVLLVAAGDIFSGSPFVDQYDPKGYPIIEVMNKTGFDLAVLGNHEFDYGIEVLQDRIRQSSFPWICANINTENSLLTQPDPYHSITLNELKITFLGLIETFGHPEKVIPATHPLRVEDLVFQPFDAVAGQYSNLKQEEGADLLVALTHLGSSADRFLANEFPFFDLIIGGHTNDLNQTEINGIPTLMAGGNLSHLGRVDLTVHEGKVTDFKVELIDLSVYNSYDASLMELIESYENDTAFQEVVGNATSHHDRTELGCFYTTALKNYMQVDLAMQNGGGIRDNLDEGEITKLEIYSIDPFNNGSVVFTKTAREIKDFFIETGRGLHVTGITLERAGSDIVMRDATGAVISDDRVLTIGLNDYIPSVHEAYFDFDEAEIRPLTTAESLIQYLKTMDSTVDFEGCDHFFDFD